MRSYLMGALCLVGALSQAGEYVVTYEPASGARFEIVGSDGLPWDRPYSDLYPEDGYDDGAHSANEDNPTMATYGSVGTAAGDNGDVHVGSRL